MLYLSGFWMGITIRTMDKWIIISLTYILVVSVIAFLFVVFQRKKYYNTIKEMNKKKDRYQKLLDASLIPMMIYQDSKLVFVNKNCLKLLDATKEELQKENPLSYLTLSHMDTELRRKEFYEKIANDQVYVQECTFKNKKGEVLHLEISTSSIIYKEKPAVQVLLYDITNRKKQEKRVQKMLYHDPLTGMNNSLSLQHYIDTFKNKLYALIFVDIDHLKKINDTCGHKIGDKLLLHVSSILKEKIDPKHKVYHIVGNKFAVLVEHPKDEQQLQDIAEEILHLLEFRWEYEQFTFYITVSIGISYIDCHKDSQEAYKQADTALYEAKAKGRNTYVFFNEEIQQNIIRKIEIENDLRQSLENNDFIVYYQPQVDVVTGETIGVECLIRWNRPNHGIVTPEKFIWIAEETGLIIPIGQKVFYSVCEQVKKWQDEGYKKIKVAINISLKQFQQPNFLEFVKNTLNKTQVNPSWIELEITESLFLEDLTEILNILNELKKLGFTIAIDDFGTGYSSLSYLKRLPIDKIKIDRSFIQEITCNASDVSVVKTILDLANNLKLKVIAEGVETKEQLKILENFSCHYVQGYLFSKPLNSHDVQKFLSKQT